jgi:hypothetical protein
MCFDRGAALGVMALIAGGRHPELTLRISVSLVAAQNAVKSRLARSTVTCALARISSVS